MNTLKNQSSIPARERYTISSVTSKDGTVIGYRQFGKGPGLVLVQGTMGTAQNFMELALALADKFTVYVPDRRGRGMSSTSIKEYSTQKEVKDLDALLRKTDSHYVFGLSAGAFISLQAALTLPAIHKLAIFEPPIFLDGLPTDLMARYEDEITHGKFAGALVTGMLAAKLGPPIFNFMPRWLLESIVNMGIKQEEKKGSGDYVPMKTLALTLHNDFQIVREMNESLQNFRHIQTEMLLLSGNQSPQYLRKAVDTLYEFHPKAKRVELLGMGHAGPWNADRGGQPQAVARELHLFFSQQ
jgi:pimeloyl-ACP methyl ester carboxylesterase